MALTLVTPASELPVSVDEVRDQARATTTREDVVIDRMIRAVTTRMERELRRALLTQTWVESRRLFPCGRVWTLPKPPLQGVTSVTYITAAGATQTMSASLYVEDAPAGPNPMRGSITLVEGAEWPTDVSMDHPRAAAVTFVAGYGATPAAVPDDIRHAILMLSAHYLEHREPVVTGTIATPLPHTLEWLWSPYIMREVAAA